MTNNNDNMGDTFNFNGSIGQFVKEGDGIIHDYHAQSVAASSSVQEEKTVTETAQADASDTTQLSNRQVVILMTGLLDISLSPDLDQPEAACPVSEPPHGPQCGEPTPDHHEPRQVGHRDTPGTPRLARRRRCSGACVQKSGEDAEERRGGMRRIFVYEGDKR